MISELLLIRKKVIVPIMNSDELTHSELTSIEEISTNQWGIMEPKTKILTDLDDIDIILVPLLALDKKGNRLGYGKGYYDKFLTSSKSLKIGLVFEDFVYDTIPYENHDVKLDGFVTERGYNFATIRLTFRIDFTEEKMTQKTRTKSFFKRRNRFT